MSKKFAALQFVTVAASASLLLACDAENNLEAKAENWRAEAAEQKARFEADAQQAEASSGIGTNRPQLTGPRINAARSAESYLSMMGFSRKGLIEQLSSDAGAGYAVADATAAVDSLSVDWNLQAARKAKSYLDMMGFSCKGLIEQLSSSAGDGFSVDQATYGAQQAGAC